MKVFYRLQISKTVLWLTQAPGILISPTRLSSHIQAKDCMKKPFPDLQSGYKCKALS